MSHPEHLAGADQHDPQHDSQRGHQPTPTAVLEDGLTVRANRPRATPSPASVTWMGDLIEDERELVLHLDGTSTSTGPVVIDVRIVEDYPPEPLCPACDLGPPYFKGEL